MDKKVVFNRFANRTFKVDILTLFLSLFITSFALSISYSYFRNYKSIMEFSRGTVDQVSAIIVENVAFTKFDLEQAVTVAPFFRSISEINASDSQLVSYMFNEIQFSTEIAAFYIGTQEGSLLRVTRLPLSEQTHYLSDPQKLLPPEAVYALEWIDRSQETALETWYYKNENLETVASETLVGPTLDPRERPWYKDTEVAKGIHWTDVYTFSPTNELGMTVGHPLLDRQGKFIGVVGADLSFVSIAKVLAKQKIGKTGGAFVLNKAGEVIISGVNGKQETGNISEHVIRVAFEQFFRMHETDFVFESGGIKYLAHLSTFPLKFGEKWLIAVIVPLADFFSDLLKTQTRVIFIALGILLLSTLLTVYFSKRISAPIVLLAQEVDKIKNFDLSSEVRVLSPVKEINLLDFSISAMRIALHSFVRYVPREVVKQLFLQGKEIALGGEKKELTILFSDIAGFTSIAETYPTESLMVLLEEYFDDLSKVILKSQGTIDKYIGDSIMAFWGAPIKLTHHTLLACETALRCKTHVAKLNKKRAEEGKPLFDTRFGINTGTAIVGNIGTSERMNYTVIGDAVNIAARLEQINKEYHSTIAISEEVFKRIEHRFVLRPLGMVAVRGKKQKIKVYELMGAKEGDADILATQEQIELCQAFFEAYDAFELGDLQKAKTLFGILHEKFPDDLTIPLYLAKSSELQ